MVGLAKGFKDGTEHTLDIAHHVFVGKVQGRDAMRKVQIVVAPYIFAPVMRVAINFDGEFCAGAIEVYDPSADHVLAAKLEAYGLSFSQGLPEPLFRLRGIVAHCRGALTQCLF